MAEIHLQVKITLLTVQNVKTKRKNQKRKEEGKTLRLFNFFLSWVCVCRSGAKRKFQAKLNNNKWNGNE